MADAAVFHPHIYWADALEQVERDSLLAELDACGAPGVALTQPETRAALRTVLQGGFQVVVANPPYITEKDPQRKAYHREEVNGSRRYLS